MPDTLTIAAVVTRPELALPDLALENPGVSEVVDWQPAGRTPRATVQRSGNVDGGQPTNLVLDPDTSVLTVRIFGASQTDLYNNVENVLDAFTLQYEWDLTVTIDGAVRTYACIAGGAVELVAENAKFQLMATPKRLVYRITVQHQPV